MRASHVLGTIDLRVSRLGLGLAAFGRPGYINLGQASDLPHDHAVSVLEAQMHAVLDSAWSAGIRYFDAARSYGRAVSCLLAGLTTETGCGYRRRLEVGSIYTVDWRVDVSTHEDKDHLLATLQRQWQESRVLVGSYLRLYQVHSATLESGVLNDAAVLAELARIKAGGLAVGLSSSGPNQAAVIERAVALEIDGGRLFDVVQATWNVLEPSAGPQLATARQAGVGVIVKEGVANGRLTGRNTVPSFQAQRQVLEHEARRLNTTLDALALAAARAQPWADTVLSGAATEQQL